MHINKKGVSLMVGYALLVVIAIALAAVVYPYLKARLPIQQVQCPADLSISIEEAQCNRADWSLTVKLLNRGLFNISGAYIRFAESERTVRQQINENKELYLLGGLNPRPLGPGEETSRLTYSIGSQNNLPTDASFVVEVQPAIFKKGALVPCANKIITQTIPCVSTTLGWLEQEMGNQTSCDGQWYAEGSSGGSESPCLNVHDSVWTTFATAAPSQKATYYVNYSTPVGAGTNSYWVVKYLDGETINVTIPPGCWSTTKLQFKVEIDKTPIPVYETISLHCLGTTWISLSTQLADTPPRPLNLYEEKMVWEMRS